MMNDLLTFVMSNDKRLTFSHIVQNIYSKISLHVLDTMKTHLDKLKFSYWIISHVRMLTSQKDGQT